MHGLHVIDGTDYSSTIQIHRLLNRTSGLPPAATLETMLSDDAPSMPAMRYGYEIWKFVTVPILAPANFNCWGCVGSC